MGRKLSYRDPAGDMAKSQLQKIEMYAAKLNDMIHPDDELETWVQSKLARISTDIGDIKHYLDYEIKKMASGGETQTPMDAVKMYNVAFKYEIEIESDDDDDDDDDRDVVRIVKVYATSKEEAERITIEKYSPYLDDFEIIEILEDGRTRNN